ncbi:MAG: GIY-YIG nuclease family protein [Xenococcaceae cyanobacterium MO_188.B29]|nr:GIY-YIG nuclease family protein [Xenococcaceae cyanobacterium MO_188.B29]
MFEPETVDLSELPSFPLSWKKALPKTSGIYFAIDSEDVIHYIGMSKNINNRWISHHRYEQLLEMEDIKLAWLEVSDIKLKNYEN